MRHSMIRSLSAVLLLSVGMLLFGGAKNSKRRHLPPPVNQPAPQPPRAYNLAGAFWAVNQPSIVKQDGTWYVFTGGKAPTGGQFTIRCSNDLKSWRLCGQVFKSVPDWIKRSSPQTKELQSPDISYFHGIYRLYYAYSDSGGNTSGIALATNRTLVGNSSEYQWDDQGLVLRSGQNDSFNAVDPDFVVDAKGATWLAFGSLRSGIKLTALDPATGKPIAGHGLISLASRHSPQNPTAGSQAIEAPSILHHGDYYYLFVSWDQCCRGANSSYRIMVGRAREITGPYLDRNGVPMTGGGGTQLLAGNARWAGPGGESVLPGDGQMPDIIAFHAYDTTTGKPALQISTLTWQDGWPQAALGTAK
jgi:arabinan endo-1,5-alpha-L-arabinosidase